MGILSVQVSQALPLIFQDLSAFAMPLLESDLQDGIGTMDFESDQHGQHRSSSTSSGIKGLISGKSRQRNRSGDDSKTGSPTTSSKVKSFFDTFRPRSKSDVSGLKKPGKKSASGIGMDRSMDETHLAQLPAPYLKQPTDPISPMGLILEGQLLDVSPEGTERMRHKSAGAGAYIPARDNFMNKFRARSNSDSRTKGTSTQRKPLVSQVRNLFSLSCMYNNKTFAAFLLLVIILLKEAHALCEESQLQHFVCLAMIIHMHICSPLSSLSWSLSLSSA